MESREGINAKQNKTKQNNYAQGKGWLYFIKRKKEEMKEGRQEGRGEKGRKKIMPCIHSAYTLTRYI